MEFVYITLKRNAETEEVVKLFTKEPEASRICRRLCCVKDEIKDCGDFGEQQLNVFNTVEPDQINWMNMEITFRERKIRFIIQIVIGIFVIIGSIMVTAGLQGAKMKFGSVACNPNIVYTPLDSYLRQKQFMLIEFQKRKNLEPEKSDEHI